MKFLADFSPQPLRAFMLSKRDEFYQSGGMVISDDAKYAVANATGAVVVKPNGTLMLGPWGNSRGIDMNGVNVKLGDDPIIRTLKAAYLSADALKIESKKYGVYFRDGVKGVAISNYKFNDRMENDIYGAGVFCGGASSMGPGNTGEMWFDNFEIDLNDEKLLQGITQPTHDYRAANNEGVCFESGNPPVNFRLGTILNGQEASLDVKSPFRLDGVFVSGGSRLMRLWYNQVSIAANSIFCLHPNTTLLYTRDGTSKFKYFNCLFGYLGQPLSSFVDDPLKLPNAATLFEHEGTGVGGANALERLTADPFVRSAGSFNEPYNIFYIPKGFVTGVTYDTEVKSPFAVAAPVTSPTTTISEAQYAEVGKQTVALFQKVLGLLGK